MQVHREESARSSALSPGVLPSRNRADVPEVGHEDIGHVPGNHGSNSRVVRNRCGAGVVRAQRTDAPSARPLRHIARAPVALRQVSIRGFACIAKPKSFPSCRAPSGTGPRTEGARPSSGSAPAQTLAGGFVPRLVGGILPPPRPDGSSTGRGAKPPRRRPISAAKIRRAIYPTAIDLLASSPRPAGLRRIACATIAKVRRFLRAGRSDESFPSIFFRVLASGFVHLVRCAGWHVCARASGTASPRSMERRRAFARREDRLYGHHRPYAVDHERHRRFSRCAGRPSVAAPGCRISNHHGRRAPRAILNGLRRAACC